jgi:RNA polymerase sigma-70 factor (ECF subfamily)
MEKYIMSTTTNTVKINLREYYPWYTHDEFIEVTEEVAAELRKDKRYEKIHKQRMRRNLSIYSLDVDDNIEAAAIVRHSDNPEALFFMMENHCRLCRALNSLPETQGYRVEAHFLLGMSYQAIADAEGVNESAVRGSVKRGLRAMKKYYENISSDPIRICPQSEAGI